MLQSPWLIFIESYLDEGTISGEEIFDFGRSGLKFGMKKENFINIILKEAGDIMK